MKRQAMPEMKEGVVNVTPLIDIVMCLIIFFMLVAHIGVSTGADTSINIPETLLGGRIDDIGNALTLNIRVTDDGPQVAAMVGNDFRDLPLAPAPGQSTSPLVDVLTELRKRNKDFKVIIRADKDMAYRHLEPVLIACSQAGVSRVNFNTKVITTAD